MDCGTPGSSILHDCVKFSLCFQTSLAALHLCNSCEKLNVSPEWWGKWGGKSICAHPSFRCWECSGQAGQDLSPCGADMDCASEEKDLVMPRERDDGWWRQSGESQGPGLPSLDWVVRIGPFKSWFQNGEALAMQESGGDGPSWRKQLMLRPKGRAWLVTGEGQSVQSCCERGASGDRRAHHRWGVALGCK